MSEMKDVDIFLKWQSSPVKWICDMFKMEVQPLKEGYVIGLNTNLREVKKDWFGPWKNGMITWQQYVSLLAVERGISGGHKFISISSGHGVGKSSTLSWLLLWGLFCFKGAQIPCTANTVQQLYDVLWKEVSIWHGKLPEWAKNKYLLEKDYIRFEDEPGSGRSWFARAATSKKENPEALAGVHSQTLVMALIDEASGICDEVFEVGEGAMTNENVLMVLISNYTRREGYFHRSQVNKSGRYMVLSFSSEDSPLVSEQYLNILKTEYGYGSDNYRVRVQGLPPKQSDEDDDGWMRLFENIGYTTDSAMAQPKVMGVDPGGLGRNDTGISVRDPFKVKLLGTWSHLTPTQILGKVIRAQEDEKIGGDNIVVDGFGEGTRLAQEAINVKRQMQVVLVGEPSKENKRFANLKAEMYWRFREWVNNGGQFIGTSEEWEGLENIYYKFDKFGRIEMMGKREIRKKKLKGIDAVESAMLTFLKPQEEWTHETLEDEEEKVESFDRFSLF